MVFKHNRKIDQSSRNSRLGDIALNASSFETIKQLLHVLDRFQTKKLITKYWTRLLSLVNVKI